LLHLAELSLARFQVLAEYIVLLGLFSAERKRAA
jgi:hypothetical protein